MYPKFFKRIIDFILAAIILLFIWPFFLVIIICLHFSNKGAGVFFYQERPGKNEKIFKIIKFKSMTDECDSEGNLLDDDLRLTRIGKFIRTTSIDELPQLINVLLGNMSFIGPRPLLPRYLPYYTDRERIRHTVRPGITGLSQVNGRNKMDWNSRLEMDVQYVENMSFIGDIEIVFKTILNVIQKKDIEVVPTGKYLDEERCNNTTYNRL